MVRPGLEEITMQEDVKGEFRHLKEGQDRVERHLQEQDRHQSDHFRKFQEHLLIDQELQLLVTAHLKEHNESRKHRWVIVSGIVLTALSTLGMLAVEIIKHLFLKG